MKLSISIEYEAEDAEPEDEAILEEIVGEEARRLAEVVRQQLVDAGVKNVSMTLAESQT